MAVSIAQYVDLLFKKLQGVAKTANSTAKGASNESIASPPLLRGDVIWTESNQIANTAQVISGITLARTGANSIQCTPDTTVAPIGGIRPTWLTNTTYWIPQEFGSTWLPKVFVGPSAAANIESTGTQIFAAGIGGVGEYFFDTQAGVLNFIGETIPTVLTAGNVVYVSGYTYSGLVGTVNLPGNTTIGNLVFANTTITTNQANGNIVLEPTGTGIVIIDTITGLTVPAGNTSQRPTGIGAGTVRFNTLSQNLEVYDGTSWVQTGSSGNVFTITNQTISPDGVANAFVLNQTATSASVLLTINGVNQTPEIDYVVSGNSLALSDTPLTSDIIQVRFLSGIDSVDFLTNTSGNAIVQVLGNGSINITTGPGGNIYTSNISPVSNAVSSLGTATSNWTDAYLSGNLKVGNINNSNANGVGNIGSSTTYFNTVFAQATSVLGADLAEKFTADQVYGPGTVLVHGGEFQVTLSTKYADSRAAGIVTTNPAHLMNAELQQTSAAIALAGQVPCLVSGPVNKGDVLTTSTYPGYAEKLDPQHWQPGVIVAKALESCGSGLHTIIVSVNH